MSTEDVTYYIERARQEREAEKAATDPVAASAHRLLALEYEDLASTLKAQNQPQDPADV